MAKRPRKPIDLPGTAAETRTLLDQIREHRKDVTARNRKRENERDQARKIRIAARLVHFVRRDDSAAKTLLDLILNGLRDGDRPLFIGWDLYPAPPPPVPISAQHLPRTLQEIDDEIRRLEEHLEKRLAVETEDDKRHHRRRMTIIGGALLGLVEAGAAEAGAMLDAILQKIPKKERKPFDGWNPPRLPVQAERAAVPAPPSQAAGAQRNSSPASPRDASGKDEKVPPASPAGQTATSPVAGKDDTTAAKRSGKGSTPTATSAKNDRPRAEPHGSDAEGEPSEEARAALPAPPSQAAGAQHRSSSASPDASGKDEKATPASHAGQKSTQPVAGKDDTAAAKRGGEGSTPTATSAKNDRARTEPRGSDAEGEPSEPTMLFDLALRQEKS